jgi:hypothetical protein
LLGAAGLSLSLASGASAATEVPTADTPTQNTAVSHEITFGEEEIADVSLATFYVFDKENVGTSEFTPVNHFMVVRRRLYFIGSAPRLADMSLPLRRLPSRRTRQKHL